ncbi:MAG TPA: ATP-binding protein, partial [Chloroflexota bacterium]|nr:ATP-binding protein [Chloroflexota bacterium]
MARQLFGIHGAAIGEDFLHLVQTISPSQLREPIDAALRDEEAPALDEVATIDSTVNETRYIRLQCRPHRRSRESVESVMLQALDITRQVEQRRALEQEMARASLAQENATTAATQREAAREAALAAQEAQMRDLTVTNLRLREANKTLVAGNNDLRGLSEEYLISSEEAQAASEEVETLNEELQASNEELETLNEEMQSTVEELHATNDDLEARSDEMQEMAGRAEMERARLEAILGGLSDAVLVVDAAGRPALANRAYDEFFGAPATPIPALDVAGKPLPPDESPAARAARGETFSMEFALETAEGGRRWFDARGQTINSEGQRQGVIVLRDVTERSLRRLQEEFLALASHELSTPLTVIRGYLQMLVRALDRDPERARECAQTAVSQVEQLSLIARDLVDVARLQGGQLRITLQPVDLVTIVRQVADLAPTLAENPPVRLAAPEGPLLVRGDAGRLQQVLLNLLTNAFRYASEGEHIDLRLLRRGDRAEFQVQDYGPGIDSEQLPTIFSRFVQGAHANRSGMGLGLYIAREIVTLHGGAIQVDSAVGAGATFTVALPLLVEDVPTGPPTATGGPPDLA